jgi:hypothetical protein
MLDEDARDPRTTADGLAWLDLATGAEPIVDDAGRLLGPAYIRHVSGATERWGAGLRPPMTPAAGELYRKACQRARDAHRPLPAMPLSPTEWRAFAAAHSARNGHKESPMTDETTAVVDGSTDDFEDAPAVDVTGGDTPAEDAATQTAVIPAPAPKPKVAKPRRPAARPKVTIAGLADELAERTGLAPHFDAPAAPAQGKARKDGSGPKLAKGGLHAQVQAFLAEYRKIRLSARPKGISPGELAAKLNASSGAVGNALERLVATGEATRVSERPKRYQPGVRRPLAVTAPKAGRAIETAAAIHEGRPIPGKALLVDFENGEPAPPARARLLKLGS